MLLEAFPGYRETKQAMAKAKNNAEAKAMRQHAKQVVTRALANINKQALEDAENDPRVRQAKDDLVRAKPADYEAKRQAVEGLRGTCARERRRVLVPPRPFRRSSKQFILQEKGGGPATVASAREGAP